LLGAGKLSLAWDNYVGIFCLVREFFSWRGKICMWRGNFWLAEGIFCSPLAAAPPPLPLTSRCRSSPLPLTSRHKFASTHINF
jgi:hypothetical protein